MSSSSIIIDIRSQDASPVASDDCGLRAIQTYLRDQDTVAGGDAHGEALAVLVEDTGANSEDLGLVLLLDAALGQEDTGGSLGLGLDALDQDAVQEGSKVLDVTEERLIEKSTH